MSAQVSYYAGNILWLAYREGDVFVVARITPDEEKHWTLADMAEYDDMLETMFILLPDGE